MELKLPHTRAVPLTIADPPPLYLPFDDGPYRMAMGLQAVAPEDWIEIDRLYPQHMDERRRLLAERQAEVIAAEPGTEAMCDELLAELSAHLAARFPLWFTCGDGLIRNHLRDETWPLAGTAEAQLNVVGHLVQEDFCLLRLDPEGPRLVAAVLCFPSHWSLREKLGRTLAPIHDPVPFYGERLARPVDRFFAALKPGRIAVRLNWTVTSIPDLFQPSGHNRNDRPTLAPSADLGEKFFLRVERQSFRTLPQSGAIVFGIRVHVTRLADALTRPQDRLRLAKAVEALPEAMQRYKSMLPFRAALLGYLRGMS